MRILSVAAFILAVAVSMPIDAQQQQQAPPTGQGQGGGQGRGRGGRGMDRPDRPQRDQQVVVGTGSISGRVIAADTSRPVKRARIILTGGGRPFAATTDDQGRFRIVGLPAATFNIVATKSGFVDTAFGQRRTARTGTPVQLADAQQLANLEIKLARGGVITGRIADEDGEPLARAIVSVMRYQYVRGERQLVAAGVDQTDDRGQYRIFGLPPGEYVVSATTGGAMEQIVRSVLEMSPAPPADAAQNTGYAPTYYPGVINAADAMRTKIAAGQEAAGIDFQVQLVPLAVVRGVVAGGNAVVMLIPEGGATGGGGRGGGGRGGLGAIAEMAGAFLRGNQPLRASTQADGTFAIRNVPPGNYTILARADGGGAPGAAGSLKTAMQPLQVAGEEVTVALTPMPGVSLSGTITLESSAGTLPKGFDQFRVNPAPIGAAVQLPRAGRPGNPDERGDFTISDLMPGAYAIRANGPRGWTMKTVYLNGRDVTDDLIEIKNENVSGLNVIFSDRTTTLAGTVRDAKGAPAASLQVIVFADDPKYWTPQSRRIQAARTDANGTYRIAGLPAGSYLIYATDDVEQGEWFDPAYLEQIKGSAAKLTLGDHDQKTLDLKASS
jgi:carboxypeptidase family protein